MKKLNLAIIGQGRSGRDIHGAYLKTESNTLYNVAYIVDFDAQRREIAANEWPDAEILSDYRELFDKKDVDLVLNASYSDCHFCVTEDLLKHGFNVLVEKPFARNVYECEKLIKIAEMHNVVLAVFQQSFYAPFFTFAKEVADSGKLGEIKQVSIHYSNFARRWDWQTLQCRLGGNAYNTGPHPIGLGMAFLDFADDIAIKYSAIDSTDLSSGDAEDYIKIILGASGKPVCDIEISSLDAYSDYNIKIQGTRGTYKCNAAEYSMKYIVDGENPQRDVVYTALKDENGLPIYCGEELKFHEKSGKFEGSAFDTAVDIFYKLLYSEITEGKKGVTRPEIISRLIGIIEALHAENPLPLKFTEEELCTK